MVDTSGAVTTGARVPGAPWVDAGHLVSTHPATGVEVGRYQVAGAAELAAAVARARDAGRWWAARGVAERRRRLLRWRDRISRQLNRAAGLLSAETGKPAAEAVVETAAALASLDWAAKNARRVLAPRRVRRALSVPDVVPHLEYHPYGVVGVISPWNYPYLTPVNSIAYALAAGNAVIHKPSEYTPATGQWLNDTFTEVVSEFPVLQTVHGLGPTGEALCRAGVHKISFCGATATARRVMAACAETLTPLVVEAGGKDAMIVDADADLDAAAEACAWGALTNAGQTCVAIERVYVVDRIYDGFLSRLVSQVERLTVGSDHGADMGPITMPAQVEVIRRHIEDALARGARAVVGGADAVRPPYVHPTILVDVPADALAAREETFGPTLVVTRVDDADEALRLANDTRYGLGGAVYGRERAMEIARKLHSGMASVNDVLSFAGVGALPWGGVGGSGFGRLRGDDGLREFAASKSIVVSQLRSPVRSRTFRRTDRDVALIARATRFIYGRRGRP